MEEKEKKSNLMQALYDKLRQEDERSEDALKVAQRRYEAISMGNFMNEVRNLHRYRILEKLWEPMMFNLPLVREPLIVVVLSKISVANFHLSTSSLINFLASISYSL